MRLVILISEATKEDIPLVGGKGANLGEMYQAGFPVPKGFIVTAHAYDLFMKRNQLYKKVYKLLKGLNPEDSRRLQKTSVEIERLIENAPYPEELRREIEKYYEDMGEGLVAVRSSATAEDLPDASFAGQQKTFLNVFSKALLLKAVKKCFASLFEARAIYYRIQKGFSHEAVKLAVPVQKMVASEVSGIMFTADPLSFDRETIIIEAGFGLGEAIVSGAVTPDIYEVDKSSLEIKRVEVHKQSWAIVYDPQKNTNVHKTLPKSQQEEQKLSESLIKQVAALGRQVEAHYQKPQDIEWAVEKDKVYLIQTRPITTLKKEAQAAQTASHSEEEAKTGGEILLRGTPASLGVASGPVRILHSPSEIERVAAGDVLVTEMTTPDYVPAMKKAVAIVTDTGGKTSHAAIVSRELGVPCVVGTGMATHVLKEGMFVTIDGTRGLVYKGKVEPEKEVAPSEPAANIALRTDELITATKVYVNLAEPELAQKVAALPVDGVGLLRAEFMLSGIGEHPKAMLEAGRGKEFTTKLAEGIAEICSAFYPRPVVYRATDFKTNEYHNLKGGEKYEPKEENPMIGFRGAARYIKEPGVFNLELDAILEVRERRELKNLYLMIPFVRTCEEMRRVQELLAQRGLQRSRDFKLWMMVEVPSNVILLKDFLALGIDGVSLGTNDLTQLILGVDRDNAIVASEFDERDPAVVKAISYTVRTCRQQNVTVSICGQAPSVFPEITELLVREGATSVSVSPDMILPTRKLIASVEKRILLDKELGI